MSAANAGQFTLFSLRRPMRRTNVFIRDRSNYAEIGSERTHRTHPLNVEWNEKSKMQQHDLCGIYARVYISPKWHEKWLHIVAHMP